MKLSTKVTCEDAFTFEGPVRSAPREGTVLKRVVCEDAFVFESPNIRRDATE